MKKQSIFFLAVIIPVLVLTSCGKKNEAKDAKIANQSDSISYTLGLVNGDAIKQYYMSNVDIENEDAAMDAFLKALEKSYNNDAETDELYSLGLQIGGSFKEQEKNGLMGEPDLDFNYDLVKQGFMDGVNQAEGGMTREEAEQYIQTVMMEIQQEKMKAVQELDITEEIIEE